MTAYARNRPSEVIYQVYPASFRDANGDGHGDLKGIIEKLDYIKSLDVDAVWISPFFLSPAGPAGDGGYAISDYRRIGPEYGTMQDFERLLAEAHKRGLRVYTDFVLCHTSDEHAWFEKSRRRVPGYENRYVWHDGRRDAAGHLILENGRPVPPNNWESVFRESCAWQYDDTRQQFYLHHFNTSQPALNLNDPTVQDASLAEMKFWLDKGVDGLRIDALPFANYDPRFRDNPYHSSWQGGWESHYFAPDSGQMCQDSTLGLIARMRDLLDRYHPPKIALGEVVAGRRGGQDSMEMAAEYLHPKDGGRGLNTAYTQSLVQFWYQYPPPGRLREMIRKSVALSPDGGFCNNLGNHDFPRYATRMMDGNPPYELREQIIRQLMALAVALPGSFCMYNGEELGLTQATLDEDIPPDRRRDLVARDCRDPCRTPMPWNAAAAHAGFTTAADPYLPVPASHRPLAVDVQERQPGSMLNFTRRLIRQRKENPALAHGCTQVLDTPDPIVAFVRRTPDQAVLCAFNMSDRAVAFCPGDSLDEATRRSLNIARHGQVRIQAFGCSFHGLQLPARGAEQGMQASPPLSAVEVNGHHGSGRPRRIFAADLLIADNHVPEAAVAEALREFRQKEPDFVNGGKSTMHAAMHGRFMEQTLAHRRGGAPHLTAGGSTACTLRTLKALLGAEVDVHLLGLAADDAYGRAITSFLREAGITLPARHWPEGVRPVTAVSQVIRHSQGRPSIITCPGTGIAGLHRLLEQQPDLLEKNVRESDIVYLPESTMSKFGLPFFNQILEARWRHRKELVLALPTCADFGPEDSGRFQFLIPSCNLVMGNDAEFARILDHQTARPVSDAQMTRITARLQDMFRQNVLQKHNMPCSPYGQAALITRGERPALLVTEDHVREIPAARLEQPKNLLGAGDAAFAGFLTGYVKGLNHEQSAALAMGLAAEKLQQDGHTPFLANPPQALARALRRRSLTPVANALTPRTPGPARIAGP